MRREKSKRGTSKSVVYQVVGRNNLGKNTFGIKRKTVFFLPFLLLFQFFFVPLQNFFFNTDNFFDRICV